jgi:hypothetical protein
VLLARAAPVRLALRAAAITASEAKTLIGPSLGARVEHPRLAVAGAALGAGDAPTLRTDASTTRSHVSAGWRRGSSMRAASSRQIPG